MIKFLNPPLAIGNVEILSIDIEENLMHAIVHYVVDNPKPVRDTVTTLNPVLIYMVNEGFIPPYKNWKTNVGVIFHPAKH
jgi:hypothetical protein